MEKPAKPAAKQKAKPVAQDTKPENAKAGPAALSAPEVHEIFAKLAAAMPDPKTELEHVNPYTLLVAVVLSAQATDAGVNKATRSLFAKVDTPQKMVALGEEGLREAIKTIGLFNTKAKNVIALSKALVENHGGTVPPDRAALEALPGVGRKSANVVLNVAFGQPSHRGGHAYLPGREPHRPCLRQNPAGSRARPRTHRAAGLYPQCSSLAHPSRPLCLQGEEARMLALRHRKPLQIRTQNASASRTGNESPSS